MQSTRKDRGGSTVGMVSELSKHRVSISMHHWSKFNTRGRSCNTHADADEDNRFLDAKLFCAARKFVFVAMAGKSTRYT